MTPIEFPEQTRVVVTPGFLDLPIFEDNHSMITCWELTPEELAEVQRTGKVWCSLSYNSSVLGYIIPMMLMIEKPLVTVESIMDNARFFLFCQTDEVRLLFAAAEECAQDWNGYLLSPDGEVRIKAEFKQMPKSLLDACLVDGTIELTKERAIAEVFIEKWRNESALKSE